MGGEAEEGKRNKFTSDSQLLYVPQAQLDGRIDCLGEEEGNLPRFFQLFHLHELLLLIHYYLQVQSYLLFAPTPSSCGVEPWQWYDRGAYMTILGVHNKRQDWPNPQPRHDIWNIQDTKLKQTAEFLTHEICYILHESCS